VVLEREMAQRRNRELRAQTVGVLGGLGPLASAAFLKTIYEFSRHACEQEAPRVLLMSDPTYPDRTEALLGGRSVALLDRLALDLTRFDEFGVRQVVICCVTIHHLLPQLPEQLRPLVLSLIEIALEHVILCGRKQLLLCSIGTRRMRVFECHPLWPLAADLIVIPDPHDQDVIHNLIYRLKQNDRIDSLIPKIDTLLARYNVDSFLAGCTEIHLLIREAARCGPAYRDWLYVDPLTIVAEAIVRGVL
jgi:aspartate racemase